MPKNLIINLLYSLYFRLEGKKSLKAICFLFELIRKILFIELKVYKFW